jgi:hypothetical protein
MAAQDTAFNKFKFKFNTNINYYLPTKWEKEINVGDLTKLKIYVNCTDYFQARNINMFTNYILTFFVILKILTNGLIVVTCHFTRIS